MRVETQWHNMRKFNQQSQWRTPRSTTFLESATLEFGSLVGASQRGNAHHRLLRLLGVRERVVLRQRVHHLGRRVGRGQVHHHWGGRRRRVGLGLVEAGAGHHLARRAHVVQLLLVRAGVRRATPVVLLLQQRNQRVNAATRRNPGCAETRSTSRFSNNWWRS